MARPSNALPPALVLELAVAHMAAHDASADWTCSSDYVVLPHDMPGKRAGPRVLQQAEGN